MTIRFFKTRSVRGGQSPRTDVVLKDGTRVTKLCRDLDLCFGAFGDEDDGDLVLGSHRMRERHLLTRLLDVVPIDGKMNSNAITNHYGSISVHFSLS